MAEKNKVAVQKEHNQGLLWILRVVLTLVLFAILYYLLLYPPPCPDYCHQLPSIIRLVLLVAAFVIFLVIVIVLKSPPAFSIAVVILVVLVVTFFVLFSLGTFCPNPAMGGVAFYVKPYWIVLNPSLHAGSSELELTFHHHTQLSTPTDEFFNEYKINGIKCIKANSWSMQGELVASTPSYIGPPNESAENCTGYASLVYDFKNGTLVNVTGESCNSYVYTYKVYCTDEDASIPVDTSPGTAGCFDVYMNYTNVTSGETYIATAKMSARYW